MGVEPSSRKTIETYQENNGLSKEQIPEFPDFLGNTVVHERSLLEKCHVGTGLCPGSPEEHYSVLQCCGAAVGKWKEVGGWRQKEKFQMSKFKIQMSN
jgi:hypothetical protein